MDWLGSRRLSWRDLLVLVKHSSPGTALFRALGHWDLKEHLAAVAVDLAAQANWQRGGDAQAKKPTPIPRPGATPPTEGETIARGKPVSIEQMNALLGWSAPKPPDTPTDAKRKRDSQGRFTK